MRACFLLLFCVYTSFAYQQTDFRQSKNVIISINLGGSSHANWVLEIGNVLAERGHNVTFLNRQDTIKNALPYRKITTHALGPNIFENRKSNAEVFGSGDFSRFIVYILKRLNNAYPEEISYYKHHFFENQQWKPDVFICDIFNNPCIDSAKELKVPLVTTATAIQRLDFNTPYIYTVGTSSHYSSEQMSILDRIYSNYIATLRFLYHIYPETKRTDQLREQAGFSKVGFRPFINKANELKLINSFEGLRPAQYLDTMTHLVGPIIYSHNRNLTLEEGAFLNKHKRIAYIAFGQHNIPKRRDLEILLDSILFLLDSKLIDGVIWVKLEEQIEEMERVEGGGNGRFTKALKYKGRQLHSFRQVLKLDDTIYSPSWASQFAILQHPSSVLFVSHGGAESVHEALFHGVPMIIHPIGADQEMNGNALMAAGVAFSNKRNKVTSDMMKQQMSIILKDREGSFSRNLTRMKILANINSNRKYHAADLVEEHMLTAVNGISLHRIEISKKMSWWKARNIDTHLIMCFAIAVTVYIVVHLFKWIGSFSNKIHL